ncbi:extensin family protein [Rhizobium sp. L1K21]|uniref:extensin-like domain-containing protein n=1 Tax=Rhizobium sp. L1K21 TaxID=2954933 RepID=UPI0020936C64|nr:extensin family protein [Rhizobium sp. L1K21]MCO6185392.1 extensin family protein [Rhizobium sp. L1K21]
MAMTKWILIAVTALALAQGAAAEDIPIPQERPKLETPAPASLPVPTPTSPSSESTDKPSPESTDQETEEPKAPVAKLEKEDLKELAQCLSDLRAEGAAFKTAEQIDDGDGCGIDKPIILSEVLPGIKVIPEAKLRCQTALQLSRWTKDSVLPAAKVALSGDKLTVIENASDYVCRKRNNAKTGKISEHAHGNAIDIGGFRFASGKRLDVEARDTDSTLQGAFQRAARATACLYFTTVLGPGSDDAHKTHFHIDILERSRGYRYCR